MTKKILLIGVMTTKKYLDTRAVAAFNTWTNYCSGTCKVIFFSSEGSTTEKQIPLVSLDSIDDSYPPQRKSLLMLKYMHDNYINNFEWFMGADDDIFVIGNKIEKFLRCKQLCSPFHWSSWSRKKEEKGKLNRHEIHCMGGPRILFSHTTLRHVGPHISICIDNLLTTHEDVEVGRCVRRYTGLSCTWAFEVEDNINQVLQLMNKDAHQKGKMIDFKDLWYGYRRVSPLHGVDYKLDLLITYCKDKGDKMTAPVRRQVYLHQTFREVEFIEDPSTASSNIEYKASDSLFIFISLGKG
ncbi:chondroitin sulfate synthase [Mytilus galloprovincialis]|uniref:Hexosyltransferase n=1 Tax=Mytilus galloprovincialis TaxID=29158 RepID=A0A8B6FVH7_MYTGA|nr:chondroitin sulfate synthase [Mytilus galloprovincialis]